MTADTPIPILLYHRLGSPPRGARVAGHYVSPGLFRRHLAYLRARGRESIPLSEAVAPTRPLPPCPVAITFDDGYRCLHTHAGPALAEFGFTATVFMVSGGIGGTNYWETAIGDVEEPMLGLEDLQELRAMGLEIGSHTVNHAHLTRLSAADAAHELAASRKRLEDLLGADCPSLAYPYGEWDARVRDQAAEAGYAIACTTRRAAARAHDDPLALPRINIRRYNVVPYFAHKLRRALSGY